jgi:hypothetical protein
MHHQTRAGYLNRSAHFHFDGIELHVGVKLFLQGIYDQFPNVVRSPLDANGGPEAYHHGDADCDS